MSDALLQLTIATDAANRAKFNKFILDTVFNDNFSSVNLVFVKARIIDNFREKFTETYKKNLLYCCIIEKLRKLSNSVYFSIVLSFNKAVVFISKSGYLFRLDNNLLYNCNNNNKKRFVIFILFINVFLENVYNIKYYFGCNRIIAKLDSIYFKNKRKLVKVYLKKYYCYNK